MAASTGPAWTPTWRHSPGPARRYCAAICIKPKPLYPKIDASVWQPTDWTEWQQVIAALVSRYSVQQPTVTHWEIGNEVDIGEDGGCPYLIRDGEAYGEYYSRTIQPILQVFPRAKVGGPANAYLLNEPLPGWLKYCRRTGAQLDFLSWHLYHSDPGRHAMLGEIADVLCRELLGRRPAFFVTEWNRRLGGASEDESYDPRRAAAVAASILDMRRAGSTTPSTTTSVTRPVSPRTSPPSSPKTAWPT